MNEVSIKIAGNSFRFWQTVEINRPIDSFSSFAFTAPFDPDVPLLSESFEPFTYKEVVISIDDSPIITGTLFVLPSVAPTSVVVACSGYSKPGVLNDCGLPFSAYPLEFDDVNLQTIAENFAGALDIDVVFNDPPGVVFEQIATSPNTKILAFLIGLAKQRSLLISDTVDGELLFFKPIESGKAVATVHQDDNRFLKLEPTFNDQQFFSSVTGLSPNMIKRFSEDFTVENTALQDTKRPYVFTVDDTIDVDLQSVVKAKAGRMFADAIGYTLTLQGWRDDFGDLWKSNTIIKLLAPGGMVYNETDFIIKNARLKRADAGGDTVTLSLVLPGAYNGKIPEVLPWARS